MNQKGQNLAHKIGWNHTTHQSKQRREKKFLGEKMTEMSGAK